MRQDPKDRKGGDRGRETHVVFDFTGLDRPNVGDLSLILTARLQSASKHVWARALPPQTKRILEVLRLDHMFRTYPSGPEELN